MGVGQYHRKGGSVSPKYPAISEMEEIVIKSPEIENYVDLASICAIAGRTDKAIMYLEVALGKGYKDYITLQHHDDFDLILKTTEYLDLLKKYNI